MTESGNRPFALFAEPNLPYRTMLEHLGVDIALFDLNFRYLYVNPTAENDPDLRLWLIGRDDLEYCHREGIEPARGNFRQKNMKRAVKEKRPIEFDEEIITSTGEKKIFSRKVIPLLDPGGEIKMLMFQGQDFTAQKETERRLNVFANHLQNLHMELRLFIESSSGPIFCIDREWCIIEWNRTMAKVTGLDKQTVLGENFFSVCSFRETSLLRAMFETAFQGIPAFQREISLIVDDDRLVRFLISTTPGLEFEGEFQKVWAICQDITELWKYREQLQQMVIERTGDLILALEKEKEMGEAKSRLVNMASHEFRTPLATILSTSDLLLHYHDRLDETRRLDLLGKIQKEVQTMTGLLEDFLYFGRGEAGNLEFRPEPVQIQRFARECIPRVMNSLPAYPEVKWVAVLEENFFPILDKKLFERIFLNLLSNALKYSPPDSVIDLALTREKEGISLQIKDRGIGIPKNDQNKLFRPFFRGSNTKDHAGTGLGLAIARMATELHGGHLELESEEGHGTSVRVFLPADGFRDSDWSNSRIK